MKLVSGRSAYGHVATMLSEFLTAWSPEGIGFLTWGSGLPVTISPVSATRLFKDLAWNWDRLTSIILLVTLYSDSRARKVDSTSQCEGCQSGQLLSITEKIRKVGRGQITGGIAGYGEDCGGYSLSVIGSH